MEKLISDKELECINDSMEDVINNVKVGVDKLLQIITYFNIKDYKNKENIEELLDMNKSFSDYFDMIEERLKEVISHLDSSLNIEEDYEGVDIETQLDIIEDKLSLLQDKVSNLEKSDLDILENKANNSKLDKIPNYARAKVTENAHLMFNKLPIDQLRCNISNIDFNDFEKVLKKMLEDSDIQFMTNDEFYKTAKEILENMQK